MSRKLWRVKSYNKEKATLLAEKLNISPYAALLMSTRGIETAEQAESFLGLREPECTDPFLFNDMDKAVKRIKKALDEFERIAVYGDYDCDGVTSTALLYSYLEMQGADVVYAVPDRHTEGYGLNYGAIDKLCKMGARLIITVDNGISAVEEAEYIYQLDMELIVTDHHLPGDTLPRAEAVVDPHRADSTLPFREYAGVGVAYKLICALEGECNEVTDNFLDLAAIGTVADVMPIKNENRSIVRAGIERISDPDRTGIRALLEKAGMDDKPVTSSVVSFVLAPRINAAGRMGTAEKAVRLLLSDDYDEASSLADEVCDDNVARQSTEQEILAQAKLQIKDNPSFEYDRVLVVSGENWHDGVIGIVASRLTEEYGRPSVVITVDEDGEAKGSGRSIPGFDLYSAIAACSDGLTHFGGHTLAAGLGMKREHVNTFRREINRYALSVDTFFPVQEIDVKLKPACIDVEFLDTIALLEPFGSENPQPVFGLYNMTITDISPVGGGKHLKLTLARDKAVITAMKFKTTAYEFPFIAGDAVDIAVNLEENEFLGKRSVSLFIKNIKLHVMDDEEILKGTQEYYALMRGDEGDFSSLLPDRDVFTAVYKFIRSCSRWQYDAEMLCFRLGYGSSMYGKILVAVEAMLELGTLVLAENGALALPENNEKVNLADAPVIRRINGGR